VLLAEPAQPGVDFVEGLLEVGPQALSELGVARALQDGRQASPQLVGALARAYRSLRRLKPSAYS